MIPLRFIRLIRFIHSFIRILESESVVIDSKHSILRSLFFVELQLPETGNRWIVLHQKTSIDSDLTSTSITMIKLLHLCICLVAALSVRGFSPVAPWSRSFGVSTERSSFNTRRFATTGTDTKSDTSTAAVDDDDDDECMIDLPSTPSSVFGSPLNQGTKNFNRKLIHGVKGFLFDTLFQGSTVERAYARFYALETIARMPYFSYVSVLHLFETLGMWRKADYLKVHFAESWNELHHLLIMEELGGNEQWNDRFVAQHIAFFYYWIVVGVYIANPTLAYNLNQAVEEEAYDTYNLFMETNKGYLQGEPPAQVAVDYYTSDDLYLYDAMHFEGRQDKAAAKEPPRRPKIETLYDVFRAVRDDEYEHVKTMAFMQGNAKTCE